MTRLCKYPSEFACANCTATICDLNTENPFNRQRLVDADVRQEAINWLVENIQHWPQPQHLSANKVSNRLFRSFRFAQVLDGDEIVFANGLVPGITEQEWIDAQPTGEDYQEYLYALLDQANGALNVIMGAILDRGEPEPEQPEPATVKGFTPNKYHRVIRVKPEQVKANGLAVDVTVDVYDVLDAFTTGSAAVDHAVKKQLAPGQRGNKDRAQDIAEAIQSLEREVERLKLSA